jgi:glycine/D-amino acid oxidase-like deaminating enzyme
VPVRLIGSQVQLRTDDGRLLAVVAATGEVVAEHVLVAPGEASARDEHDGGPRPDTPPRAVRPKTAAEKEFCSLGPVAERSSPMPQHCRASSADRGDLRDLARV